MPDIEQLSIVHALASGALRMHRVAKILRVRNTAIFYSKCSSELAFENASHRQNSQSQLLSDFLQ